MLNSTQYSPNYLPFKSFPILLSNKLKTWYEKSLGEYQDGFREGRSTMGSSIFVLRQMFQKSFEFNTEQLNLFVDIKQADDSIKREELMKALVNLVGIP